MIQQLDLFAGNQIDLFAAPPAMLVPAAAPAPAPEEPRHRGGMPRSVERRWALACTVPVRQELLDVAMSRPGEWLDVSAFRDVSSRHEIGFCCGSALTLMAGAGMLEQSRRFYGSDHPGKPNYQGFQNIYRWRFPLAAEAREGFGHA